MYANSISLHFMIYCSLYGAPFIIIAGILNQLLVQWSNKNNWSRNNEILSSILQYLSAITTAMIFTVLGFVFFDPNEHTSITQLFSEQYFQISMASTPILNIFILFLARYTGQIEIFKQQEEHIRRIEAEIIKIQYSQLKAQVNPHFLFNSLNILTSLINSDPPKAAEFTKRLATIYRYLLSTDQKDLISLDEELHFCNQYSEIIRIRYGPGINITIPQIADSAIANMRIIPTALQVLIENACKHNIISVSSPLVIDIHINDSSVTVTNNISPRPIPADSTGLGLKGLKEKYQILTDKDISINSTEKYFKVTIPLLPK